jgi:hypothetical protein
VRLTRFAKAALGLCLAVVPAFAQFTRVMQPTPAYISATTLVPITGPDFTAVSSVTNGTQTITLGSIAPSGFFSAQTVPSGGWATWNSPPFTESSTPRVLATFSAVTSLTLTLTVPSATVGFEIEPEAFGNFTISAAYYNGVTLLGTITQVINGNSGALLAAGSSSTPITSVVITSPSAAAGFAMAQFRTGNSLTGIPTLRLTAMATLGLLLAAGGAFLARSQQGLTALRS